MLNDSHDNSTVLAEGLSNFTESNVPGKECHTNDDKVELSLITMNMLRGLIVFYALLAFVTILFLDNLEKSDNQVSSQPIIVIYTWVKNIWLNIIPNAKLITKKEMILSIPLFITSGASIIIICLYSKVRSYLCTYIHTYVATYGGT